MRGFVLRLAGCVLFLPLAAPFLVMALLAAAWILLRSLVLGWDDKHVDAILFNPVLSWAGDLPLRLFDLADGSRKKAASA